jgi:hypothetical protein
MDNYWKLRHVIKHKLLDDALPVLQAVVKATSEELDPSQPVSQRKSKAPPRLGSLAIAQEAPFTAAKVVDAAADLAALARTIGGPSAAAAGAGFLRASLVLDPARVFALLAVHYAALGQKADIVALAKEAASPAYAACTYANPVQMFCLACAGDCAAAANLWKIVVSKPISF